MNSLKILIVEDEIITATDIKETLEKVGHQVIAMARNYHDAITAIKHQIPDIALIDIHLGVGNSDGISVAKELLAHHPIPIIYLTAHSEVPTFQRAKETLPAAYLLKPFRQQELAMQVELAYYHFQANRKGVSHPAASEDLYLPIDKKGYEKIVKNDVVCLKAEGAYVKIFLHHEKKTPTVAMNIGYLEQFFPAPNFYRLSRSYLININHIERMISNEIHLSNYPTPITIPEGSRKDFLNKLPLVRSPQ